MSTTRGRIGDYALVQWRDYALGPMIWTILAVFLIGAFPLIMMNVHSVEMRIPDAQKNAMFTNAYDTMVGILAFIGGFLAVSRFVSKDRSPGLTRFLFSKPIGVTRYYVQTWLVRILSVVALSVLTAALVNEYIFPVDIGGTVASVSAALLLIGGVGFLISVVTAQDTLLLIAVYLIPDMLEGLQTVLPGWKWLLNGLLMVMPPMHKLDDLRHALIQHSPALSQGMLWHVLLYGAGSLLLAAYLVRRMPLVR